MREPLGDVDGRLSGGQLLCSLRVARAFLPPSLSPALGDWNTFFFLSFRSPLRLDLFPFYYRALECPDVFKFVKSKWEYSVDNFYSPIPQFHLPVKRHLQTTLHVSFTPISYASSCYDSNLGPLFSSDGSSCSRGLNGNGFPLPGAGR